MTSKGQEGNTNPALLTPASTPLTYVPVLLPAFSAGSHISVVLSQQTGPVSWPWFNSKIKRKVPIGNDHILLCTDPTLIFRQTAFYLWGASIHTGVSSSVFIASLWTHPGYLGSNEVVGKLTWQLLHPLVFLGPGRLRAHCWIGSFSAWCFTVQPEAPQFLLHFQPIIHSCYTVSKSVLSLF